VAERGYRTDDGNIALCTSVIYDTADISRTPQKEYVLVMAALRSRCGHYIIVLWFLSSFLFLA